MSKIRIAHLILVHKNPAQVLRLLLRLQHPNFDIFVHVDEKVSIDNFIHLSEKVDFRFIKNRTNCNWGGNSVLMSIINSVEEILGLGVNYDFINVISGQDYALMSPESMLEHFDHRPGTNFISFDDSPESKWWQTARNRYERYHFTDFNFKGKYLLQYLVNKLTRRRKFTFFDVLYGGSKSTWWTITGDCASYLVKTIKGNKKLNTFLKYSWCTDEFMVATIIMNSNFKNTAVNNNLRYIDWSENKASPKILGVEDFGALEASKMMFARKLDIEVNEAILNLIDQKLLARS